jgi:hypothetical protein
MVQRYVTKEEYQKELRKQALGDIVANHLAYIVVIVLYDKCDMTYRQVENYYKRALKLRQKWQDDNDTEITSEKLLAYAADKKIDVVGFVRNIPSRQKIAIVDSGRNKPMKKEIGMQQNIDYAILSAMLMTVPVLKETYRFSKEKFNTFFAGIAWYIELYTTKQPKSKMCYCDDETIRQVFISEENWDITRGEKVESEVDRSE